MVAMHPDGFPLRQFITNIIICLWRSSKPDNKSETIKAPVTPNGVATAFVQRSKTMSARCGNAAKYALNIKFASYSVYTTSSQRPYSVHTTFPRCLFSVHNVFTARKQLLQRVHGAHTTFSRRAHSVLKAIIAFKIFTFFE